MKAIILARVSTQEQEDAGNSIPAQIHRIEGYCQRKGFEIAKTFSFDESAYKSKRDEFDKTIEFLNKSKEVIAICCDKIDRFSRNIFDKRVSILYDMAMAGKVELHFCSDNQVVHKDISAVEKFHFSISLGLAKYYSDAISDNVKRAFEQKRRRGEYTRKAPIGYLNDKDEKGNKNIIFDPERAPFIVRAYELYASGDYSIKLLAQQLEQEGFKTLYNRPVRTGELDRILNNTFYYGQYEENGTVYTHKYAKLISRELYNKVQEVRASWNKKPFKYASIPFSMRGIISCAQCGCTITPQKKKGKYTYYHCTQYKGNHNAEYVKEEVLFNQVEDLFKGMKMTDEMLEDIANNLRTSFTNESAYHNKMTSTLRNEHAIIQKRFSKLYDDFADGSITKDFYDDKVKEYKQRQDEIMQELLNYDQADENFLLTSSLVLELGRNAYEIFKSSEPNEKRQLLNFLLQNCLLDGKKLIFNLKQPFDAILAYAPSGNWQRGRDSNP